MAKPVAFGSRPKPIVNAQWDNICSDNQITENNKVRIGNINSLFISDVAKALYERWAALPRPEGQTCPKRLDFDFDGLPVRFKKHSFLLTSLGEGVLSASDIGDEITAFLGEKLDGQDLAERHGENQMKYEVPYYDALYGTPCAGVLVRRTINQAGTHADFVTCHLPLLDYQNKVRSLLGVAQITNIESVEKTGAPILLGNSQIIDRVLINIGTALPVIA